MFVTVFQTPEHKLNFVIASVGDFLISTQCCRVCSQCVINADIFTENRQFCSANMREVIDYCAYLLSENLLRKLY